MSVWKFSIEDEVVKQGEKQRLKLTRNGCNEPFRDRFWCPKRGWFRTEPCPFVNRNECENYRVMCGSL